MAPAGPGSPLKHASFSYYSTADVPAVVHNLIRDMKALEAALCNWGAAKATPEDVSDCFVQFGIEFNAVARAFQAYDISISELYAIPTQLRTALEDCLGDDPRSDALDRYLPEIRRLIKEVLQCLRAKQPAWQSALGRPSTAPSSRSYSPPSARLSSGSFP